MALIKMVTVIVFITVGLLTIVGIMGGYVIGFEIFSRSKGPTLGGNLGGGLLSVLGIFLTTGFSSQGTELIGTTVGESKNSKRAVPKAIRQISWRILLSYILAIFIIDMLIPYGSSALTGGSDNAATSPFTLVFESTRFAFAASFMNVVILMSVLSAGNSGMYASTRILYSMSKGKLTFEAFGRINKNDVPYMSLLVAAIIIVIIFMLQSLTKGAYEYIVTASGSTGFIVQVGIAVSHYRFGRAFGEQDYDRFKLEYTARLFPFGSLFADSLRTVVIIDQDVGFIKTGDFNFSRFLITYMGIPVFLAFFIYHKLRYKTKEILLEQTDLRQDVSMDEIRG